MAKPPYAHSSAGALPSRGVSGAAMMLSGTRVPSRDVANSRVTSYDDKSTDVLVATAVGRGVWPSTATHHVAGEVNDSHDHATLSAPSADSGLAKSETELSGGSST